MRLSYTELEQRVFEAMSHSPKLITVWVDGDLLVMDAFDFRSRHIPSRGELRLALEFVEDNYPLFKCAPLEDTANFIRDIFYFDFPTRRLRALKPFKKLFHRTIITDVVEHNGKYYVKTKRVLKHKQKRN